MSVTFRLNQLEFEKQIHQVIAATGKDAGEVVTQEAKLFVQDVIRFTPPFSTGPSTESYNQQRRTGENAVQRDIKRVMTAVEDIKFLSHIRKKEIRDRVEKLIRKRDTEGLKVVLRSLGIPVATVLVEADPKMHARRRDRRGRVQRSKGVINVVMRGLTLKRYIREKQSHVGQGKSGWLAAARGLGIKLPAWITRHQGAPGKFIDNTKNTKQPSITVGNLVDYVQESGSRLQIIERALRNRARNMKAKVDRIISSGWKKR